VPTRARPAREESGRVEFTFPSGRSEAPPPTATKKEPEPGPQDGGSPEPLGKAGCAAYESPRLRWPAWAPSPGRPPLARSDSTRPDPAAHSLTRLPPPHTLWPASGPLAGPRRRRRPGAETEVAGAGNGGQKGAGGRARGARTAVHAA
jgi:hypothetical protein